MADISVNVTPNNPITVNKDAPTVLGRSQIRKSKSIIKATDRLN